MKCFNCSAEISEGLQFCPQCGVNQGFTKELIDRARNNDQAAITELYNKTYSSVYYTVKAMIKDEDAALDILQDSYIKAFKSLDQLKEPEKFKAWVKQIAHNRSIDYLRKTKPLLFSEMESADSDTPLEFEDTNTDNLPEAVIDRDETSRLIREILNDLPDEQRAVISMFYYEQLSVKEIAEQLGVSENTVKSRLNYGRKKIETKVLDLEKKGTKLYGLAPIPFLLLLFKTQSVQAASVAPAVSANVLSACSVKAAAVTATKASSGIIGTLKSSLAAKITAGVLSVAVVGGATFGIVHGINSANNTPQTNEVAVIESVDFSPVKERLSADYTAVFIDDCTDNTTISIYGNWYDDSGVESARWLFTKDVYVTDSQVQKIYWMKAREDSYRADQFYITISGTVHYQGNTYPITGIYFVDGLTVNEDNSVEYIPKNDTSSSPRAFYVNEDDAYQNEIVPYLEPSYDIKVFPIK